MLSEYKKSINSVLFERVTSPLFGNFVISWLLWNWRIPYLTLFISESKIKETKIDYILSNYIDFNYLITYPILSTIILITLIPFISNGSFFLNLKFKNWKIEKKNQIENTQLLSIEKSVSLRKQLRENEIEFEKILQKNIEEGELLKAEIKELKEKLKAQNKEKTLSLKKSSNSLEYNKLKLNKKAFEPFEKIVKSIKEYYAFPKGIKRDILEYYLINKIIGENFDSNGSEYYTLTSKGESLYKEFFNEKFGTEK